MGATNRRGERRRTGSSPDAGGAARPAAAQLRAFLAKYSPEVAATARQALTAMRRLVPGATELVYDNYNALAIGFAATERTSNAVVSLAVYPRWVSLFFLQSGTSLPDPTRILRGSGARVRHVVLTSAADLARPDVRALLAAALIAADPPLDANARRRLVIKSVSARQRPRRPAPTPRKRTPPARSTR